MPRSAVDTSNVSTSVAVVTGRCAFHGVTLRETGGTNAVVVRIFDNASAASGALLFTRRLAANECFDAYYGVEDSRGGIRCDNGIYVEVTGTGVLEGAVRFFP